MCSESDLKQSQHLINYDSVLLSQEEAVHVSYFTIQLNIYKRNLIPTYYRIMHYTNTTLQWRDNSKSTQIEKKYMRFFQP